MTDDSPKVRRREDMTAEDHRHAEHMRAEELWDRLVIDDDRDAAWALLTAPGIAKSEEQNREDRWMLVNFLRHGKGKRGRPRHPAMRFYQWVEIKCNSSTCL